MQKVVLKGKFIAVNAYNRKEEISKNKKKPKVHIISLEKEQQYKPKGKRRKEIIKTRAKIIEVENIEATKDEIKAEYDVLAGYAESDKKKEKTEKLANAKKQYPESRVAYKIKTDKVVALLKEHAVTKEAKKEEKKIKGI